MRRRGIRSIGEIVLVAAAGFACGDGRGPTALAEDAPGGTGGDPAPPPVSASIPAFPGAEGFGSRTPGGRGGEVVIVTSLADDGPGSLREALEGRSGLRIVVFEVAGIVRLARPLVLEGVPGSFVTIAGQSAPGGGVTIAGFPLSLRNGVHDVVVRHLRVRNPRALESVGSIGDGIELRGASNVVLDHVSVAWATDEGISIEVGGNHDITVQNSLVAETLLDGGHPSGGPHSRCMIVSDGSFNVTMHRNLLASCNRRSPALNGSSELGASAFPLTDFRHNLVYNWGRAGGQFARGAQANLVDNVYRFGPDTGAETPFEGNDRQDEGTTVFLSGNCEIFRNGVTGPDVLNCPADQRTLVTLPNGAFVRFVDGPVGTAPFVTPPADVAQHALERAGALPRDAADLKFVEDYRALTGELGAGGRTHDEIVVPEPAPGEPEPDRDRDGMPDGWESAVPGLDPDDPSDAAADLDGDGYTEIEEYLNDRAEGLR